MDAISDELKELSDNDEYYSFIYEEASRAAACLWDFLQNYDSEARGKNDL